MKLKMMMAQSVDGIIARHNRHFPDWTCREDKRLFKRITQEAGVLIMGSRTYATIGKPLPGRLNVVYTRFPEKLPQGDNVLFTAEDPSKLLADLEHQGYREAILTGGAAINTLFARKGLIDEILLTVSPVVFGSGILLFSEPVDLKLNLLEFKHLDSDTLFFHYRVVKNATPESCSSTSVPHL